MSGTHISIIKHWTTKATVGAMKQISTISLSLSFSPNHAHLSNKKMVKSQTKRVYGHFDAIDSRVPFMRCNGDKSHHEIRAMSGYKNLFQINFLGKKSLRHNSITMHTEHGMCTWYAIAHRIGGKRKSANNHCVFYGKTNTRENDTNILK